MEFWLDEVQKYKENTSGNGIIGLSATKNVQDAILKDAKRHKTVDLIDIRYWHYKEDGSVYAPEGGKNLAPRQHARKMNVGKETEAQVYRAVREYRTKYPEKAVLYSTDASSRFGWAVLMAGGSLANIPKIEIPGFYGSISKMQISENQNLNSDFWCLEQKGEAYIYYLRNTKTVEVDLSNYKGTFEVFWIDASTGKVIYKNEIQGNIKQTIAASETSDKSRVVYIKKK
jgi:hypothetical protein